ncbi:MAG: type II toxin-antitoxin system HicA family toxin [Desulfobacterales bacterium]|nr:type II toxin-antitoxin system HicA family toxin [Desulfobacterales bacterium]
MSKIPRLTARQLISALKKAGFEVIRIKGSHHYLQHPGRRSTVVPVHSGETIGVGLMNKILSDCEIGVEELKKYL